MGRKGGAGGRATGGQRWGAYRRVALKQEEGLGRFGVGVVLEALLLVPLELQEGDRGVDASRMQSGAEGYRQVCEGCPRGA